MERAIQELRPFMNEGMQLTALPAKRKKKLAAYYYLAGRLEAGRRYTEAEINDILDQWTVFPDPATLRRGMYNMRLLNRTAVGADYWQGVGAAGLAGCVENYV